MGSTATDGALLTSALVLGPPPTIPPQREAVDAVPGAFVIRGALTEAETTKLAAVVRLAHQRREQAASSAPAVTADSVLSDKSRRDSQHHIPIRTEAAALSQLAARLRPLLPKVAGPPGGCKAALAPPGSEVSGFLRCYHYKEGDISNPHFDRSFREHDNATPAADLLAEGAGPASRRAGRGPLVAFSAFSILLYLNDDFEGGCTTFFSADDAAAFSRKGRFTPLCERAALTVVAKVEPRRGDVLIFPHGTQVSGTLYPSQSHKSCRLVILVLWVVVCAAGLIVSAHSIRAGRPTLTLCMKALSSLEARSC